MEGRSPIFTTSAAAAASGYAREKARTLRPVHRRARVVTGVSPSGRGTSRKSSRVAERIQAARERSELGHDLSREELKAGNVLLVEGLQHDALEPRRLPGLEVGHDALGR